jgi:hypothetical protein
LDFSDRQKGVFPLLTSKDGLVVEATKSKSGRGENIKTALISEEKYPYTL